MVNFEQLKTIWDLILYDNLNYWLASYQLHASRKYFALTQHFKKYNTMFFWTWIVLDLSYGETTLRQRLKPTCPAKSQVLNLISGPPALFLEYDQSEMSTPTVLWFCWLLLGAEDQIVSQI